MLGALRYLVLVAVAASGLMGGSCLASSRSNSDAIAFLGEAADGSVPFSVPVAMQADVRGFERIRTHGTTNISISQINRTFWQSSFESAANRNDATSIALAAADMVVSRTNQVDRRSAYSLFSPSANTDTDHISAQQPGLGACLLAMIAIIALAVSRRRSGYEPIVPARSSFEIRSANDGAR
jgi:hypothetical protein